MRLILINGKPGTGKSSVSRKLLGLLPEPAAWIDTDDLMRVRPFGVDQTFLEALERGCLLGEDFLQRRYNTLILSGCVHSAALVDELVSHPSLCSDVVYILLTTSAQISEERKRAQGYGPEKHATMFDIIRGGELPLTANNVQPWKWLSIDTSNDEPEVIAQKILSLV